MNKTAYLLGFALFFYSSAILAKDNEKTFMTCSGNRTINEYFSTNEKESLLLQVDGDRPKSISSLGKSFGTLKFSKSEIPWSYNSTLRLCGEDEFKYVLEPICMTDKERWPNNTSSIDRNCTLDKVTGKLYCSLNIYYKDKIPPSNYLWDYDCKIIKPKLN